MENTTGKLCSRCKEIKPFYNFAKNSSRKDGKQIRCRPCQSALARAWNLAHPERVKETDKRRYKNNLEKRRAVSKQYRSNNLEHCKARDAEYGRKRYTREKEKCLAATKSWIKRNPERARELQASSNFARRARVSNATGSHTKEERKILFSSYRGLCVYCLCAATTFDHVIPLARGGSNDIENLVPCCMACNLSKGARSLLQFLFRRKAAA